MDTVSPSAATPPPPQAPPGQGWASLLLVLSLAWSLLPAGLSWEFTNQAENLSSGNAVIQLQWGSLFLLAGVLALRRFERFQEVMAQVSPFLLALLVYCLLNALWSVQPGVTVKKGVQLAGMVLIGVALQLQGLDHERWLRLMGGTMMLFLVASVLAVGLIPDTAIEYATAGNEAWVGGAWRGITDQKNSYGIMTAFTVMTLVSLYATPPRRGMPTMLLLVLLAFCGLNLVMSKSTTSLLVTGLGVGCFALFRWKYVADEFVVSRVLIVVLALLLIYLHVLYVVQGRLPTWDEFFKPVADLLGKRTDISGRFDIWDMVLDEIEHHPWLGVGYGAFWLGKGSASQAIIDKMYWVPFQAHNGYLDIFNELGLVGLALFAAFLVHHLVTLYRLSRHDASEAAFHGAVIVVILVHNLTESSLLRGVNFLAMLVVYSSIAVSWSLRRHRLLAAAVVASSTPSAPPAPAAEPGPGKTGPQARYSR